MFLYFFCAPKPVRAGWVHGILGGMLSQGDANIRIRSAMIISVVVKMRAKGAAGYFSNPEFARVGQKHHNRAGSLRGGPTSTPSPKTYQRLRCF